MESQVLWSYMFSMFFVKLIIIFKDVNFNIHFTDNQAKGLTPSAATFKILC